MGWGSKFLFTGWGTSRAVVFAGVFHVFCTIASIWTWASNYDRGSGHGRGKDGRRCKPLIEKTVRLQGSSGISALSLPSDALARIHRKIARILVFSRSRSCFAGQHCRRTISRWSCPQNEQYRVTPGTVSKSSGYGCSIP